MVKGGDFNGREYIRMRTDIWSNLLLAISALCFLFGASATVLDVVLRAVANSHLPNVIEITTLSIGLGALVSIPVCFLKDTHITARLLSELKPNLFLVPLARFGVLFSILFVGIMVYITGSYAVEKWGSPERTPDLRLKMDVLVAIVFLTFMVSLVAVIVRFWRVYLERWSNG